MALPVSVPYAFANATTTQNLSYLDSNFNALANGLNGLANGASQISVTSISATGTANSNTYLRGDGAWATVSGGGTDVTYSNVTVTQNLVPPSSFLRNRIINGAMQINQRGYTSGSPLSTSGNYCVDRFYVSSVTTGGFAAYGYATGPTGFTNSLVYLRGTGASPSSSDANYISQTIEGYNISDLAWGTANAKTVTLSFWVYAGATGTFSGSIRNGAATFYAYPFTYTIAAANTWTQITVTISGPTVGTWATDNTAGLIVFFDIGSGSTFRGTAGSWVSGNYVGATGATTYPTSTTSGTFYLTGVQLEVGSVATPFERRLYGTELMLCQRYYEFGGSTYNANLYTSIYYKVTKRAVPTVTTAPSGGVYNNAPSSDTTYFIANYSVASGSAWTASSEL